ncbi:MAG: Fe-Mn family superoxide dismutase [Clostridiales bacterium]|jgi:Fe-Mn family superoxide dismutase|nr:Fe-Mn family superoxide dismutase [Clostridiales bacterium]
MEITPKKFPYDMSAISKDQFDSHIKLYNGYVDKVNEITKDLFDLTPPFQANATYSKYRGLKKGETYALDGVILHEAYFSNMTSAKTSPDECLHRVFDQCFGGYEGWVNDFASCAAAARGWCVFCYDQRTRSFRNILMDSHDDGMTCLAYPIIVLDMYEHAYFIDYKTDKAEYIKRFIDGICWRAAGKRLNKLGRETSIA